MEIEHGYSGKILLVDLSSGQISHIPTELYAGKFVGGRGFALKIYWDHVPAQVKAYDPENYLMFVHGPLAGYGGLASSRWQVCAKSAATSPEHFNYCNLGGHWGAQLKFAGYDGLAVTGAADKPVYLAIRDDKVEVKDASHLWQKSAIEARESIKSELGRDTRVVATGPAGDNLIAFSSLLADNDASGSYALASVMGSKKLKAVAVRGTGKMRPANPEKLRDVVEYVRRLKQLRPGAAEEAAPKGSRLKRESCFGCIGSCTSRLVYEAEDGTRGKVMCQSMGYYDTWAQHYYRKDITEVSFFANRIADAYGIDTMAYETLVWWLDRCRRAGILNDENTGLPLSKLGSLEFIETLSKAVAFRHGFGDVLAQGPIKAAEIVGNGASEILSDYVVNTDQSKCYGPRMYITTGLLHAIEPRQPIHELHAISRLLLRWVDWYTGKKDAYMTTELVRKIGGRFYGSELAVDFSTYDGKALAAREIQDREYIKECLILCDFAWPIAHVELSADHLGDPTIENRLYSAVTGRELDEAGLKKIGERVFNLQRAVLAREGHLGREADRLNEIFFKKPLKTEYSNPDCLAPGKDGEVFSRKGTVVDREKFEQMKTEYYQLRDWDAATGLQTVAKLHELGLDDVASEMAKCGTAIKRYGGN